MTIVEEHKPEYRKYYYEGDKLHRADGPAVEWANGTKEWWLNGKRHRADGPAVEHWTGRKIGRAHV